MPLRRIHSTPGPQSRSLSRFRTVRQWWPAYWDLRLHTSTITLLPQRDLKETSPFWVRWHATRRPLFRLELACRTDANQGAAIIRDAIRGQGPREACHAWVVLPKRRVKESQSYPLDKLMGWSSIQAVVEKILVPYAGHRHAIFFPRRHALKGLQDAVGFLCPVDGKDRTCDGSPGVRLP